MSDDCRFHPFAGECCAGCAMDDVADVRRDLAAVKATIATLTEEVQKWRDSFFTAIANRDTMRLALSSIENDICDEPFQGLEAPCGCCRSHIKTARRALDE